MCSLDGSQISDLARPSVRMGLVLHSIHHGDELLELDLAVPVLVNFPYDLVDFFDGPRVRASEAENFSDLVSREM